MAVYGDGDCLDGPEGCKGETFPRLALSGSGDSYSRCDRHYDLYVERVQPQMDDIRRRYPVSAPADFDPYYAGCCFWGGARAAAAVVRRSRRRMEKV